MTRQDGEHSLVARYWRATQFLLVANLVLFILSAAFISANPVVSLVTGGLNVTALGALVWVDRRVVSSGAPSFWRDGRLRRPGDE